MEYNNNNNATDSRGETEPLSLESGVETEQPLEDAGMCGGHGCAMCFFGVFELFTCFWLLAVIGCMIAFKVPVLLFFALFGLCFHCCTQCGLNVADPGNVNATLESLETGMDDESTAKVLEELKRIQPEVRVQAQAYHTTSSGTGNNRRTSTVIDHTERADFPFASWKDTSGRLVGLEKHDIAAVEVVPKIEFVDTATEASFDSLKIRLMDICRRYRASVRSSDIVSLPHPVYGIQGSRVFVTRTAGVNHASWMNKRIYTICRFAWPFFGTLYRTLFFVSMSNFRYTITKCVSTTMQQGPGWVHKKDYG